MQFTACAMSLEAGGGSLNSMLRGMAAKSNLRLSLWREADSLIPALSDGLIRYVSAQDFRAVPASMPSPSRERVG
jgi:hypothetical protein